MAGKCSQGSFVVISEKNKILLVRRADFPVWDLPGGHIEKNETEEQAAIRETQEETGLTVEIQYKIGTYLRPEKNDTQHIFNAIICGGTLILKGDETSKTKWFSVNMLPLLVVPHRKRQIKDYIKRIKDGKFILKEPFITKIIKR